MSEKRQMPVDGPHRVYVEPVPAGVKVDVGDFVRDLLVNLATDFAEDPSGVADDLTQIADAASAAVTQTSYGNDDASAVHERDARVQKLLDDLGGGSLLVYGGQVKSLALALLRARRGLSQPSVVELPRQRSAGGEVA